MPTIVKHLLIFGRVQGVYYRASMTEQAQALGVTGWVRNRLDGSVEALAEGTPQAVGQLVEWARQGPRQARVDRVDVSDGTDPRTAFSGFVQRPTA
ncbi:acylphosphatase [Xylophilus sp. GOD-11R]|uniref:acylphosphatase n=1 Tax=Xylophilus sp. GOD-11R TaxID=3089814 RepID=UPI00298C35EB|nr:acylphosphatase [Xylophilus sp. GOD-11R]WPB59229.1 acylphosphatase [Xylophilus sp. GOD-11R]